MIMPGLLDNEGIKMKAFLTVVKYFFLLCLFLVISGVLTAVIGGLAAGLFGIDMNISVMLLGFTAIMLVESILKSRQKNQAKRMAAEAAAAEEAARVEAARLKNEYAIRLDGYRIQLEQLAAVMKDRKTAAATKRIAIIMGKIAQEVERDPRDRKKVRSLSDHSGGMIVDLIEKYIKLEGQEQSSTNIASAMWEITSALDGVETSLKTLLDDLFSNDGAEVATNVAVLEGILCGLKPELRISTPAEDTDKEVE